MMTPHPSSSTSSLNKNGCNWKVCASKLKKLLGAIGFSLFWQSHFLLLFSILVSYFLVTYLIFFDSRFPTHPPSILIVLHICDFLYLSDFLWKLFTEEAHLFHFKNQPNGCCQDPLQRCWNDIWSLMRILSVLPIEYVAYLFRRNTVGWLRAVAWLRVNRVHRLRHIYYWHVREQERSCIAFPGRAWKMALVPVLSLSLIVYQAVSCLWYSLSCDSKFNDRDIKCHSNWLERYYMDVRLVSSHAYPFPLVEKFRDLDPFGRYLGAFLWSVLTSRSSASFHAKPSENWEMLFSMIFMTFTFVTQFFLILVIVNLTLRNDMSRLLYIGEIQGVLHFLKHLGLHDIRRSIMRCFKGEWNKQRVFTDGGIRAFLPPVLEQDIYMERAMPLIHASEVLQALPRKAMEAISPSIEIKTYFAGQFIIRPGTVDKEMMLLSHGYCTVIDPLTSKHIVSFGRGSLIGEANIVTPMYRPYGLQAVTDCQVMSLSWAGVNRVLKAEPSLRRTVHLILLQRLDFILPREQFASNSQDVDADAGSKRGSASPSHLSVESYGAIEQEETAPRLARFTNLFSFEQFETAVVNKPEEKLRVGSIVQEIIVNDENLRPSRRNDASMASYQFTKTIWHTPFSLNVFCNGLFAISKETFFYQFWNVSMFVYILVYSIWLMVSILYAYKGMGVKVYNGITDTIYTVDAVLLLFIFRNPEEVNSELDLVDFTMHFLRQLQHPRAWIDLIAIFPMHYVFSAHPLPQAMRVNVLLKFLALFCKMGELEHDVTFHLLLSRGMKHVVNIVGFVIIAGFMATIFRCMDSGYKDCRVSSIEEHESIFGMFIYWAICIVFGIGFQDIKDLSARSEISIVCSLIGFVLLMYGWAELISTYVELSDIKMKFKQMMDWLCRMLEKNYIDPELISAVNSFFVIKWTCWKGIEYSIKAEMTGKYLKLRHTVYDELLSYSVIDSIFGLELFQWMDANTLREFCLRAKLVCVAPRCIIIPYGGYVRKMYIVRRGTVEVKVISGVHCPVIYEYGAGQCIGFGEMALQLPSMVHITSSSHVELVMISFSAFSEIMGASKVNRAIWKRMTTGADIKTLYTSILCPQGVKRVIAYEDVSKRQKPPLVPALHFFLGANLTERKRNIKSDKWEMGWNRAAWLIRTIIRPFACRWSIHPMLSAERTWETFRCLVICLIIFFIPIAEALPCFKEKVAPFIIFSDVVSVVDMFFRFYTAYYDPKYNYHPAETITNYLTSAFITDLIGGPFYYYSVNTIISRYTSQEFQKSIIAYFLKLNRVVMIYHIWWFNKEINKYVRDPSYLVKLLQIIPILMVHAHFMCCILTVIGCPQFQCPYRNPRCRNDTWITKSYMYKKFNNRTNTTHRLQDSDIYAAAFYYTATTAAGCAFGDFGAENWQERLVMGVTLFFYIVGIALIMARVVAIKPLMDFSVRTFQKQMHHLTDFLVQANVDYHLKSSVLGYYEHQWHKNRGESSREHFVLMYPALREEVGMHIYQRAFQNIPELRLTSEGFRRALCDIINHLFIPMNQVIFREHDVCDMCYIIKSGVVTCHKEAYVGKRVKEFGLMGTLGRFYEYSAVAAEQLQLLAFTKEDFVRISVSFPEDAALLRRCIRMDQSEPYNSKASTTSTHEFQNIPLKRTMSDISELTKLQRAKLDVYSTHNVRFEDDYRQLEPSYQDPLRMGFQPLPEFDQDFDCPEMDYLQLYKGFVIHRDSCLAVFLSMLYFVGALGSVIIVPYQAAFKNFHWIVFALSYACDGIYITKMIVSFFVSSVNEDGTILMDAGDIIAKYFGQFRGFTYDLLTIFPFEIVAPSFIIEKERRNWVIFYHLVSLFRLNRLLRIKHVWDYFLPKEFHAGYNVPMDTLKLSRMVTLTLLYLHWMSCLLQLWTLSSCAAMTTAINFTGCLHRQRDDGENWLATKEDGNDVLKYPYIYTTYFIFSSFTAVSYGDVKAMTEFEMIFISILCISSKAWLALALADLVNSLPIYLVPKATFRLAVSESLANYKYDGVCDTTLQRAVEHLEAVWMFGRGMVEPRFLTMLPGGLKKDLMFFIYEKQLAGSYLFHALPLNFTRALCLKLKKLIVLQGECIVKSNQLGDRMFFIFSGLVLNRKVISYPSSSGHHKVTEERVQFPEHFGEENALLGLRRYRGTYVAESNVELVYLDHDTLREVLFPNFEDVFMIVMKRFVKGLKHRIRKTD